MSNMTHEEQDPDELTMAYLHGVHDGKKQRTWVGLTEEWIASKCGTDVKLRGAMYEAEAKLREDNA